MYAWRNKMRTGHSSRRGWFSSIWLLAWPGFVLYCVWRAAPGTGGPSSPLPTTRSATASVELAAEKLGFETRNIEQLGVGDRVVSRDERTGEVALKRVVKTMHRMSDHVLVLAVRSGDESRLQRLETRQQHPFRTAAGRCVEALRLLL